MKIKDSHVGRLHEALGIPEGKPIPMNKIHAALNSKKPGMKSMANFARMAKRHWRKLAS